MKRFSKFLFIFIYFFILFVCINSCNGKKEVQEPVREKIKPHRIIKNKILVILGKDYYERLGILRYLNENYSSGSEDAPVQILPYSEMTASSKYPRFKLISEKIDEYKSTIVISIGIPEGGGRYLIQIAENNPELAIITLLPMEELLPLEAASDIVVDFKIPTALSAQEESFVIGDDEVMLLLTASVFAGEDINAKKKKLKNSPLEEFREALFTAQKVIGKSIFNNHYSIKPFIDSETGIPSHKYLLICKGDEKAADANAETGELENNTDANNENGDITNPDDLEGGA